MEFTNECRIGKELTKVLEKQNQIIEGIIERIEKMEAHLDAKTLLEKNPLDLNGDGVVDKKDSSIAGKVLANRRNKRK